MSHNETIVCRVGRVGLARWRCSATCVGIPAAEAGHRSRPVWLGALSVARAWGPTMVLSSLAPPPHMGMSMQHASCTKLGSGGRQHSMGAFCAQGPKSRGTASTGVLVGAVVIVVIGFAAPRRHSGFSTGLCAGRARRSPRAPRPRNAPRERLCASSPSRAYWWEWCASEVWFDGKGSFPMATGPKQDFPIRIMAPWPLPKQTPLKPMPRRSTLPSVVVDLS